jgi:hypothetical protein
MDWAGIRRGEWKINGQEAKLAGPIRHETFAAHQKMGNGQNCQTRQILFAGP